MTLEELAIIRASSAAARGQERAARDEAAAIDAVTAAKAAGVALDAAKKAAGAPGDAVWAVERERLAHAAGGQREQTKREHAELESRSGRFLSRLSPRRRVSDDLAKLDEEIAALEQRAAASAADVADLEEQLKDAERDDAASLMAWHQGGASGKRPAATAPALREQLEERRADVDAINAAVEATAGRKVAFVERNRDRLAKTAGEDADRALERYVAAIDAVAAAREELVEARVTELWALLYPAAEAGAQPPTTALGAGTRNRSQAVGLGLPARGVLDALRADADALRELASSDQRQALARPDAATPAPATWVGTPEHAERDRAEKKAIIERLRGGGASGWGG